MAITPPPTDPLDGDILGWFNRPGNEVAQQLYAMNLRADLFTGLAQDVLDDLQDVVKPISFSPPLRDIRVVHPDYISKRDAPNLDLFGTIDPINVPNYPSHTVDTVSLADIPAAEFTISPGSLRNVDPPEYSVGDIVAVPTLATEDLVLTNAPSFTIDTPDLPELPTLALDDVAITDIPAFVSTIGPPGPVGATPVFNVPAAPGKPLLDTIVVPAPPSYGIPNEPVLEDIVIPAITLPVLPTFTATAPVFTGAVPNTTFDWDEDAYSSTTLTELQTALSRMFAGGTGLPPAVEQALFDRARTREDANLRRAKATAFETWAGHGFSLPPGMLVEVVRDAEETAQLQISELNREILVKAAEWEIENLRQAVAQGIAAETMLTRLHNDVQNRSLEALKYRLDADIKVFDAHIALFNARTQAYQVAAAVFEAELRAKLAELDAQKLQLDALKLVGDLNEQAVRLFAEKWNALKVAADLYSSQIEGVRARVEVQRGQIDIYRGELEAFSEYVGVEKLKLEAFESSVRAKQVQAQAFSAEAQAYSAQAQAIDSANQTKIRAQEAQIAAYTARSASVQNQMDFVLKGFDIQLKAYEANLTGITAENQVRVQEREAAIRAYEASVRGVEAQNTGTVEQAKAETALYEARVKGVESYNSALAQITTAEASVYTALVRGTEAQNTLILRQQEVELEALRINSTEFLARLDAEKVRAAAQADTVRAFAAAYGAEVQRFAAEIGLDEANARLAVSLAEAEARIGVAQYDVEMRSYEASVARMIELTKTQVAALDATARTLAQLGAGAMSAIHVQASMHQNANRAYYYNKGDNYNYNENHNFDETV